MKQLANKIYVVGGNVSVLEVNTVKKLTDIVEPGAGKLTTVELCKAALNNIPAAGLLPTDMFKRLQVLNKLQANEVDEIVLEDSEFETLKVCVENITYTAVNANLMDFHQQFFPEK